MSERIDDQLIHIDAVIQDDWRTGAAASFCLYTVWNAEPETVEGRLAKERLLQSIAPENDFSGYKCPVEGCATENYPKNPDYKTDEDTDIDGRVFRPVTEEQCRFKGFCLKEAWEVGDRITSEALKKVVSMAGYHYLSDECRRITGAHFPGGNYCVKAGCSLAAGFSEDGVGGTVGQCIKERQVDIEQVNDPEST